MAWPVAYLDIRIMHTLLMLLTSKLSLAAAVELLDSYTSSSRSSLALHHSIHEQSTRCAWCCMSPATLLDCVAT